MKTVELRDANETLAAYARRVGTEPVIVTVDGQPVAALIAIGDADLESIPLSTNPDFLAIIEQSRARQREEGGLSSDEVRRQLGLTA